MANAEATAAAGVEDDADDGDTASRVVARATRATALVKDIAPGVVRRHVDAAADLAGPAAASSVRAAAGRPLPVRAQTRCHRRPSGHATMQSMVGAEGGMGHDGAAARPAAAATAEGARPPGAVDGTRGADATVVVPDAVPSLPGCRSERRARGAPRRASQESRVNVCASVRAVLASTGCGPWTVWRHEAARVARACIPRATLCIVLPDPDGSRLRPEACVVDRAGTMAAGHVKSDAYAAMVLELATRKRMAEHAMPRRQAPPPPRCCVRVVARPLPRGVGQRREGAAGS